MGRTKIISCVICAVVVLVCLIFYAGYVSQMYYDVCTPYEYSPIAGYETRILEEVPEGYEYHISGYTAMDEMNVVEITYELTGVVNEPMMILGDLCHYYGERGEWIDVLEKDEDYWGEASCDTCNIVPPGEHVFFKEYVLVPRGMKRLSAQRTMGENEEILIEL